MWYIKVFSIVLFTLVVIESQVYAQGILSAISAGAKAAKVLTVPKVLPPLVKPVGTAGTIGSIGTVIQERPIMTLQPSSVYPRCDPALGYDPNCPPDITPNLSDSHIDIAKTVNLVLQGEQSVRLLHQNTEAAREALRELDDRYARNPQYSTQLEKIQVVLGYTGDYHGNLTGDMDSETRTGVASFQRSHGLSPSGSVDAATGNAIQQEKDVIMSLR